MSSPTRLAHSEAGFGVGEAVEVGVARPQTSHPPVLAYRIERSTPFIFPLPRERLSEDARILEIGHTAILVYQ